MPLPENNLRVLIVDDDDTVRYTSELFLISAGVKKENIYIAKQGAEAVRMVQEQPPGYFNFIQMDQQMPPGMGGEEATLLIREIEKGQGYLAPQIIIYTCSASFKGAFPGANGSLPKPYSLAAIKQLIAQLATDPASFYITWPPHSLEQDTRAPIPPSIHLSPIPAGRSDSPIPGHNSPLSAQHSPSYRSPILASHSPTPKPGYQSPFPRRLFTPIGSLASPIAGLAVSTSPALERTNSPISVKSN